MLSQKAIIGHLKPYIRKIIIPHYLSKPNTNWQPSDFLPDSRKPNFYNKIDEIREEVDRLPEDVLTTLIGTSIIKEKFPTYMITADHLNEEPWNILINGWASEKYRHGNMLNKYLYFSGNVNMGNIEETVQKFTVPDFQNDPYAAFIYAAFNERSSKISNANMVCISQEYNATNLCRICGVISSDESRHEQIFSALSHEIFGIDADEAMITFANIIKKYRMKGELYQRYITNANNSKIYTTINYAKVIEHFLELWNIEDIYLYTEEGAIAQEYLLSLPNKIRKIKKPNVDVDISQWRY